MSKPFYGQSAQDFFVLTILKRKRNGVYLEIGTNEPIINNNTYILEKEYGWKGILVEFIPHYENSYRQHRPNSFPILQDAQTIDYAKVFEQLNMPKNIDYLQIDLEIKNRSTLTTLEQINIQLMDTYKFATITFEHDIYRDKGNDYNTRSASRELLESRGYVRVFSDVCDSGNAYEDWYVHPDLVDMEIVQKLQTDEKLEWTEILQRLQKIEFLQPVV